MKYNTLPPRKTSLLIRIGLIFISMLCFSVVYSQTPNEIPVSGKVGIGTLSPDTKLQVKGCVKIDSFLTVKKSMTVRENAQVKGDATFYGDVYFPSLVDTSLHSFGLLMLDTNGRMINKGKNSLQALIYNIPTVPARPCPVDINGNVILAPPVWQRDGHGMFLIDQACHLTPRLGVGVKPTAKVQIRNRDKSIIPFLIEQKTSIENNPHGLLKVTSKGYLAIRGRIGVSPSDDQFPFMNNPHAKLHILTKHSSPVPPIIVEKFRPKQGDFYKLLKLDNYGLLRVREVKVNLHSWPDYVFHKDYLLMPLSQLKAFITKNRHLPDVPKAKEVEEDGLNLGETAKITMQKVEELTLYLIQLNEKVEKQGKMLQKQDNLIEAQQKTIALQQQLIRQLKKKEAKN